MNQTNDRRSDPHRSDPQLSDPQLSDIFATKRNARSAAIDRLVADAATRDDCNDRLYWTLIYDFEHAPMTTNLSQLEECGLRPAAPNSLDDAELFDSLWLVIAGLGDLGIFLLHTNHLTDRALYERLVDRILVEPVRDLPPDAGVHEFIDLIGGGGTLERELFQRHYATASERDRFKAEHGFEVAAEPSPSDRDQDLPKPSQEGEDCVHQDREEAIERDESLKN